MTTARSGQVKKRRGEGDQRRQEILSAAAKLFIKFGADKTTMRAIANEVGISSTAVYSHFPDKMAVYVGVAEMAFSELQSIFEAAMDLPTPIERLREMMQGYVRFGLNNPEAYQIAFAPNLVFSSGPNASSENNLALSAGSQAFGAFHDAVTAVPSLKTHSNVSDDSLARVLWATGHGIVSLARSKADAFPLAHDIYVDALLNVILPQG
jgi:AcrR family transcriptional regulator